MSGEWVHQARREGTRKKLEEQPTRAFAFRLCLELGISHPDYLLSQLTSRQLAEWIAFYNLHPFGQDISDRVVAEMAAALWNKQRGKGVDALKPDDFLPRRVKQQTPDMMKTMLKRYIS